MEHGAHSDWMYEHSSLLNLQTPSDIHWDMATDTAPAMPADSVLKTLWHLDDPMSSGASTGVTADPPTLTDGASALTVNAGGSVTLPISVPSSGTHAVSVTIDGLASYESVTDNLDHKIFTGASVTLTTAEVNSGLWLASDYMGTGHPVNTLTMTASEMVGDHMLTSAPQTTVVTDPPAASASSSGASTTTTSGSGLTLVVTGDNLHGTDPQIQVFVDGTQVGGTFTVTADHSQGQTQTINIPGNFSASAAHHVQVKFINDAWDGQMGDGNDINVYVESISLNGTTIAGIEGTNTASNGLVPAANANEAVMDIDGTLTFNVPAESPASTSGSGAGASGSGASTTTTGSSSSGAGGGSSGASTTTTGGSSGSGLTLVVTGDNLHGTDPQIQVFVDGAQIGGTFTVTADHSQGQTQTINIPGNFSASAAHQVEVKFINDAWDGQMGDGNDINVYVESISLNGTTIAGIEGTNTASNGLVPAANANEAVMDIDGTLTFNVPAEASTGGSTSSSGSSGSGSSTSGSGSSGSGGSTSGSGAGASGSGASTTTTGSGSSGSGLTLVVTGDNLHGTDPQIQVFVDGTQVGGTFTVTADHSQGQTQTINIPGNFSASAAHQVQVKFINDAWDGQTGDGNDINVYVESISLNGTTIAGSQGTNTASNGLVPAANANEAVMDIDGTLTFNVPTDSPGSTSGSGSSGSGSSTSGGGAGASSSSGSILPQNIVGEWWWSFNPPTIATVMQEAPEVNYLSLVGAFANGNGGGSVNDSDLFNDYSSVSALQADINAWKASGRVVVGMIGGGGDTTVIDNSTEVAQFMASAVPIIKQLGLQGVDFDLENTPDAASVASIITQLKADFGQNFIIALSPRPFELRPGGVYRQIIEDAGINNIDLVQPQDYALNGDSLSAQQSYMTADLSDWINGTTGLTIPASKILIGSFDPNEGESVATAIATYEYYKELYPTLRGGMDWDTENDADEDNFQFASELAAAEG
jgi:hypothetical protein